jgi:hypothetical protein
MPRASSRIPIEDEAMSKFSRRSLVASAASLPALALPAVAVAASAGPDPIFAVIEQCKEARAIEEEAFCARSAAQEAFRERYGTLTPSGMPREMAEMFEKDGYRNPYWALRSHKQITELKSHAELGKLVLYFHRLLNTQTNDYEENVAPIEEAVSRANTTLFDLIQRVFETVPTTLAGLRAKIDFTTSTQRVTEFFFDSDEDLGNFLNTLYASARLIAVQP